MDIFNGNIGWIEVVCGPMFSGKSAGRDLVDDLKSAEAIAGLFAFEQLSRLERTQNAQAFEVLHQLFGVGILQCGQGFFELIAGDKFQVQRRLTGLLRRNDGLRALHVHRVGRTRGAERRHLESAADRQDVAGAGDGPVRGQKPLTVRRFRPTFETQFS